MSLAEVLPKLLAQDLGQDESSLVQAGQSYPVPSPDTAHAAAATMLDVLRDEKAKS